MWWDVGYGGGGLWLWVCWNMRERERERDTKMNFKKIEVKNKRCNVESMVKWCVKFNNVAF